MSYGGAVFRDLAASGRWLTLLRETYGPIRFGSARSWAYPADAAVGPSVPGAILRLRRLMKPTRAGGPPDWLGPLLRDIWPGDHDEWDDVGSRWQSWVQQSIWRALTTATTAIPMDYRQHYGVEAGIEMRFPFLDRRLVTFVLAIPWEHRLPIVTCDACRESTGGSTSARGLLNCDNRRERSDSRRAKWAHPVP